MQESPGIQPGQPPQTPEYQRSQLCATQPATFFLPDERLLIAVVHPKAAIPLSAKPGHGLNVWFPVGGARKRTDRNPPKAVRPKGTRAGGLEAQKPG